MPGIVVSIFATITRGQVPHRLNPMADPNNLFAAPAVNVPPG